MPAFTFEKISSPVKASTAPAGTTHEAFRNVTSRPLASKSVTLKRSRGLIGQMLDRLAVARIKREEAAESFPPPSTRPPPD